MTILELLALSVGVAMDAFSVSICKGLSVRHVEPKHALIVGGYFGGFQGLMPLIGYFIGASFQHTFARWNRIIAFALLAIIGINMLREALGHEECPVGNFSAKSMIPLAVATSIDALAIGVSLSFLQVNIWIAAAFTTISTAVISAAGLYIGHAFGQKFQKPAHVTGAVVLILIGVKILLEQPGLH